MTKKRLNSSKLKDLLKERLVYFKTEEEYHKFLGLCSKAGIVWFTGELDVEKSKKLYEDKMCLLFDEDSEIRSYNDYDTYQRKEKQIRKNNRMDLLEYDVLKKYVMKECIIEVKE